MGFFDELEEEHKKEMAKLKYDLIKLQTELREFEGIRDSYCFDKII